MIAPRFQVTCADDDEDDDSEDACEDVLGRSRAASAFYGVSWASFVKGSSILILYYVSIVVVVIAIAVNKGKVHFRERVRF